MKEVEISFSGNRRRGVGLTTEATSTAEVLAVLEVRHHLPP